MLPVLYRLFRQRILFLSLVSTVLDNLLYCVSLNISLFKSVRVRLVS